MNVYETIGFFSIVLGTGLAAGGLLICAAFGAITLHRQWKRGADAEESDLRISSGVREAVGK